MDVPVLTDPDTYPTDDVLASHLGRSKTSYDTLFAFARKAQPDVVERWRYYNDGKSWLMNVSRKKKTLFWVSVHDGWFRTTFSFPSRCEMAVKSSGLPKQLKNAYLKSSGQWFRAITLVVKAKKDLAVFKELLALKLANP